MTSGEQIRISTSTGAHELHRTAACRSHGVRALITITIALPAALFSVGQTASAQNVVAVGGENMIQLTKENLIQNVLRNQNSTVGARETADNALGVHVDFVALIGTLSDAQRAKLELAGQGDIHRFFDDLEVCLRTAPTGQITMERWNEVWQELQPLQTRYAAGLHGPDSLFCKTIPSTLDDEQRAAYQELETERRRRHYAALVKATLSAIDGQIPLTTKQREQITSVVMEKTKPPRTFGQSGSSYYMVLFLMSHIEVDLEPLFEKNEWELMKRILQQGRQFENMLRDNMGVEFE